MSDPGVVDIVVAKARESGQFVISEENYFVSRDRVVVAAGSGRLSNGTVLGRVTASGKYVPAPATASDGSDIALACLWEDIDATDGDIVASIIARDAEVLASQLSYDASVNSSALQQQKWAQLAAFGIIVRTQDNPDARAANFMQQIYRTGA